MKGDFTEERCGQWCEAVGTGFRGRRGPGHVPDRSTVSGRALEMILMTILSLHAIVMIKA
jgi:hypothetical protein